LRKVEVTEGLNNMCIVVGDIMSSVAWGAGYGGCRCCGEKSHGGLDLGQLRVVLDERD
jgi:hypothetical protein